MAIEGSAGAAARRRIRLGMVGGGQGAFIGAVHRIAARLDDGYELVAGALSSDAARARASAAELLDGLGQEVEVRLLFDEDMLDVLARRPPREDTVGLMLGQERLVEPHARPLEGQPLAELVEEGERHRRRTLRTRRGILLGVQHPHRGHTPRVARRAGGKLLRPRHHLLAAVGRQRGPGHVRVRRLGMLAHDRPPFPERAERAPAEADWPRRASSVPGAQTYPAATVSLGDPSEFICRR